MIVVFLFQLMAKIRIEEKRSENCQKEIDSTDKQMKNLEKTNKTLDTELQKASKTIVTFLFFRFVQKKIEIFVRRFS